MRERKIQMTRLIRKFEAAVAERAWKGAAHPDDREDIESVYRNIKTLLMGAANGITVNYWEVPTGKLFARNVNGKAKVGRNRRRGRA